MNHSKSSAPRLGERIRGIRELVVSWIERLIYGDESDWVEVPHEEYDWDDDDDWDDDWDGYSGGDPSSRDSWESREDWVDYMSGNADGTDGEWWEDD